MTFESHPVSNGRTRVGALSSESRSSFFSCLYHLSPDGNLGPRKENHSLSTTVVTRTSASADIAEQPMRPVSTRSYRERINIEQHLYSKPVLSDAKRNQATNVGCICDFQFCNSHIQNKKKLIKLILIMFCLTQYTQNIVTLSLNQYKHY
jgi:hypothetical protein